MDDDTDKPTEEEELKFVPDGLYQCEEDRGGPVFVPQLYVQRYFFVQQELQKLKVKSVVDFGCAECKLSRFLVRIPSMEKIALVDIDGQLLEKCKENIQPLLSDYIKCRDKSLTVKVLEGSVTQLDETVCGYEAVSMVEIVEHLYPDILESACDMVFGSLQPRVVIVTTPNADYNVLFPNFSGFRHWDHKFEWTKDEFRQWAANITAKYPYSVQYTGVGDPLKGSEHLGFCSQIAVFSLTSSHTVPTHSRKAARTYKLVAECLYPYKQTAVISEDEALQQETEYLVRQISRGDQSENVLPEEGIRCLIPLSYFLKFEKFSSRFDLDKLRQFLQNHGYRISTDGLSLEIPEDSLSDFSDDDCYDVGLPQNFKDSLNVAEKTSNDLGVCGVDPSNALKECEDWG